MDANKCGHCHVRLRHGEATLQYCERCTGHHWRQQRRDRWIINVLAIAAGVGWGLFWACHTGM